MHGRHTFIPSLSAAFRRPLLDEASPVKCNGESFHYHHAWQADW